jgi:CheY-like chemotaxis protein
MSSPDSRPRRVLVVEDDDSIRESLLELLADHGYEPVGAVHGRDALAKLSALDPGPSVIVLDLMMPIMDGRSFREEQLRHPTLSRIPVIVISAYKEVSYDVQELRAAGYLKKPLKVQQLLRMVGEHCRAEAS